jgi:hypothetical protein
MKISSDELLRPIKKLRGKQSFKEVNKKFRVYSKSMSLDVEITSKLDSFDSSDYIRLQSVEIVKLAKERSYF